MLTKENSTHSWVTVLKEKQINYVNMKQSSRKLAGSDTSIFSSSLLSASFGSSLLPSTFIRGMILIGTGEGQGEGQEGRLGLL